MTGGRYDRWSLRWVVVMGGGSFDMLWQVIVLNKWWLLQAFVIIYSDIILKSLWPGDLH